MLLPKGTLRVCIIFDQTWSRGSTQAFPLRHSTLNPNLLQKNPGHALDVEISNGSIWPCEGSDSARISGILVDGLIMLARRFSVDFATYQPLRSQHSPVILCLDSNRGLPPFWGLSFALPATLHPFVSTRDTTSLVQLLRFSILFGGKLYKQLQVLEVAWKVTDWCIFCVKFIRMLAILGKFCWLELFIVKLQMCDLDSFSKIQSQLMLITKFGWT